MSVQFAHPLVRLSPAPPVVADVGKLAVAVKVKGIRQSGCTVVLPVACPNAGEHSQNAKTKLPRTASIGNNRPDRARFCAIARPKQAKLPSTE
jgi:hypothetical protein